MSQHNQRLQETILDVESRFLLRMTKDRSGEVVSAICSNEDVMCRLTTSKIIKLCSFGNFIVFNVSQFKSQFFLIPATSRPPP